MSLKRVTGTQVIGNFLLLIAVVFTVLPLLSIFSAALAKHGSFPQGISFSLDLHWENFILAWKDANYLQLGLSCILIVLGVVPASILISTMAAYAIITLKIPFGRIFLFLAVIALVLPYELYVVPLYYELRSIHLLNNRIGLCVALIGLNMAFSITWMQAHYRGMPEELTEAAFIDGASFFETFIRIHLPLAAPAMLANVMLMFLSTWNSFLLPLVLIDDPMKRTMAGALQSFVTMHSTDEVLLNAGSILLMAPPVVVFILLQKYFVSALLQGSIKG